MFDIRPTLINKYIEEKIDTDKFLTLLETVENSKEEKESVKLSYNGVNIEFKKDEDVKDEEKVIEIKKALKILKGKNVQKRIKQEIDRLQPYADEYGSPNYKRFMKMDAIDVSIIRDIVTFSIWYNSEKKNKHDNFFSGHSIVLDVTIQSSKNKFEVEPNIYG